MPTLRQAEMPSGVLIPHQEEKHLASIFWILRVKNQRTFKKKCRWWLFLPQRRRPSLARPCAQRPEDSSAAGWAAVPITDDENLIIDFNGS